MDEDNDDGLGGRSRTRREISESNRFAADLVELYPWQLRQAHLPEDLIALVIEGRSIDSPIARKRQLGRIDGWIRDASEESIAQIEETVKAAARGESAVARQVESWRQRLVDGGEGSIDAFVAAHPNEERQRIRQLVRNAAKEVPAGRAHAALTSALRKVLTDET